MYLEVNETFLLTRSDFPLITEISSIANLFGLVWLQYWIA